MGVDLQLLPIESESVAYSHTILNCEMWSEFADLLFELETQSVPKYFATYVCRKPGGDPGYGDTHITPYGEELRCVNAGQLKPLVSHECIQQNYINKAVWAYLQELPDDMRVALFWR